MPVRRRSQKKTEYLDKSSIPFHALVKWSEHIVKSLGWIVLSVYGYGETHRRDDYLRELGQFISHLKTKNSFSNVQVYEISILLKNTIEFQHYVKMILLQKNCLSDILCVEDTRSAAPPVQQLSRKLAPCYMHVKCGHNYVFKNFGWIVYSIIDKNRESLVSFRQRIEEILVQLHLSKKGYQDTFKSTDLQAKDRIQDLENMIQNMLVLKDFM